MLTDILRFIILILRAISSSESGSTIALIIAIIAILAVLIFVVLPIIIAIIAHVVISWLLAIAAKKRGHNYLFTLILCLILGIPAYLYAISLPDVASHRRLKKEINDMQIVALSSPDEAGESTQTA